MKWPELAQLFEQSVEGVYKDDVKDHYVYRETDLQFHVFRRLMDSLSESPEWRVFNDLSLWEKREENERRPEVDQLFVRNKIPRIAVEYKIWEYNDTAYHKDIDKLQMIMHRYPSIKKEYMVIFDHSEDVTREWEERLKEYGAARDVVVLYKNMYPILEPIIADLWLWSQDIRQIERYCKGEELVDYSNKYRENIKK